MRRYHSYKPSGFIMPVLLITIFFVLTMIAVVSGFSTTNYRLSARESYRVNAQLAADAGLDAGINELNIDPDWTGSGGEVTLLDTPRLRTTYESVLIDGAVENEKVLSVIARTYAPSSSAEPEVTRRYELDLRAVTSGTNVTSVVSGVGGLLLNNNSKITGGDVVVNGTIGMDNGSQIGTQTNAVNVRVAHQSCPIPADATYPALCSSGQPLTLDNNSRIYGEVHANNQTNGTNMTNPGLILGTPVDPIELPVYDRSLHDGATEYTSNNNLIRCPNNGSITWPINVKIVGDLSLGNNCEVTIRGNAWITGDFDTGNGGKIIVDDSVGTNRPVIMVDGSNGFVLSNNSEVIPNTSGTGIELYSFWSDSGCGADCDDVTGQALANSQNRVTIELGNNANAANSVFIAQWSRVRVSNNGALGAVAGQSIELSNGAAINFTASIPGSDNLTQTWVKRGYMRVYE